MARKKVTLTDVGVTRESIIDAHVAEYAPDRVRVIIAGQECEPTAMPDGVLVQPVQLSSASNEHYTPVDIVERARRLMGSIDLDPASCPEAQRIVRAERYFAQEMPPASRSLPEGNIEVGDGLALRPWKGNVFLNPPGGAFKILNKSFSNAALWWAALVQDWLSGDVKQAIFIGFTLEILRHSQNGCPLPVQAFHRCYPKKRIKFSGAQQPTHANVIVYLPPIPADCRNVQGKNYMLDGTYFGEFREHFGTLGYCEP